jgi:hypothetical protein
VTALQEVSLPKFCLYFLLRGGIFYIALFDGTVFQHVLKASSMKILKIQDSGKKSCDYKCLNLQNQTM